MAIAALWWAGQLAASAAQPLEPQMGDGELHSEVTTLFFDLEDGVVAQVQISISNIGIGDDHGACRLALMGPGQPFSGQEWVNADGWSFQAPGTLSVAGCTVVDDGASVSVQAAVGETRIDARIDASLARVTPPNHRIQLGDRFFEQSVLLLGAPASVQVSRPGAEPVTRAGWAAVDHFRADAPPGQVAAGWHRIYMLGRGGSAMAVVRTLPDASDADGWWWAPGAAAPVPLAAARVSPGSSGSVVLRDGPSGVSVTVRAELARYAPVEEQGVWGALARPFVGNPVTRTWIAEVHAPGLDGQRAIVDITADE